MVASVVAADGQWMMMVSLTSVVTMNTNIFFTDGQMYEL